MRQQMRHLLPSLGCRRLRRGRRGLLGPASFAEPTTEGVMLSIARGFAVAAAAALLAAPAAFARADTKFGPDLRVQGQGVGQGATTSVALNLTLSPSYSTRKPGVVVTMTSCNNASLKLLRRIGRLGAGQSLRGRTGRIVWSLTSVPGKPAKPKLALRLAAPNNASKLCVRASMYDNYTRKTINIRTPIPL
jgi:hypothetical protein